MGVHRNETPGCPRAAQRRCVQTPVGGPCPITRQKRPGRKMHPSGPSRRVRPGRPSWPHCRRLRCRSLAEPLPSRRKCRHTRNRAGNSIRPTPGGRQPQAPALSRLRPARPALIQSATLYSVLATAILSALLLGDGLGLNLLIVAVPAALAAFFAARAAGRRLRPWTAVWAVSGLALLAVPALRDAGWPTFLAVVSAVALGSLALHGSRSWLGVFLGSLGLFSSVADGLAWGGRGVRERMAGSRGRLGAVFRGSFSGPHSSRCW